MLSATHHTTLPFTPTTITVSKERSALQSVQTYQMPLSPLSTQTSLQLSAKILIVTKTLPRETDGSLQVLSKESQSSLNVKPIQSATQPTTLPLTQTTIGVSKQRLEALQLALMLPTVHSPASFQTSPLHMASQSLKMLTSTGETDSSVECSKERQSSLNVKPIQSATHPTTLPFTQTRIGVSK
jgi:hypothetical protein